MDRNELEAIGRGEWPCRYEGGSCPHCKDGRLVERYRRDFEDFSLTDDPKQGDLRVSEQI